MGDLTNIGVIIGVHALGGEFKVKPLTDYPDRFFSMKKLSLYKEDNFFRELTIKNVRYFEGKNKSLFAFTCAEISNVEEAEKLIGCSVRVADDERAELPSDEYWIDDLIGMKMVEAGEKKLLGTVKDFIRSGGNELYIVEGLDGRERMIPAVSEFIKDIDTRTGTITVSLIDGLW